MRKPRFSKKFRDACFVVSEHCYGHKGIWAYETFSFINRAYFSGRLPWPYIIWALTPHGKCIAWANTVRDKSRSPIICLHPSLLGGTEKLEPWKIKSAWLGPALVFDTVLHECIHIHIGYNLGGSDGPTSHNCREWVRQVNRLLPLLDFPARLKAGISKTVRVRDRNAPRTVRGKMATKVVRRSMGNIPFATVAAFPYLLRKYLRTAEEYYSKNLIPQGAPRLSGNYGTEATFGPSP